MFPRHFLHFSIFLHSDPKPYGTAWNSAPLPSGQVRGHAGGLGRMKGLTQSQITPPP